MAEDSPTSSEGNLETAAEASIDRAASRDVFVSYASQDAAIANAVVLALERDGLTCWVAPRDVTPGALYADGIIRAIAHASVSANIEGPALCKQHGGAVGRTGAAAMEGFVRSANGESKTVQSRA